MRILSGVRATAPVERVTFLSRVYCVAVGIAGNYRINEELPVDSSNKLDDQLLQEKCLNYGSRIKLSATPD